MAKYNDLGISSLESFKCFVLDNKMNHLVDNSIHIKSLLFHLIYKERYYTHKTRAKLNNLVSVIVSNVDFHNDSNVKNSLSLLPIENDNNLMKYWNLNTLQQNKQSALSLLEKIYTKFDESINLMNDFESEENCILLPLIDVIDKMANVETNTMFQDVSNDFYILVQSTKSFEDISEAQLENFLNTLTTLNVFFGERNNKGNKNVFSMNFKFIVSEEVEKRNINNNDKLHWLSERIVLLSSEHCQYNSEVDTLANTLDYFEFKDFSSVDPRVVFQGDLIFNTNMLNKQSTDYQINRIPVVGYPAIKKTKAQSKVTMFDDKGVMKKIKHELALYHKEDIQESTGEIIASSLKKENLVTVYKNGDCYSYINEDELKTLTTLNIPVEELFLDIKKSDEADEEEKESASKAISEHTLFNKSIIPMYTMDKQNFPVEYLTGESQIITCDFYSNKIPVNKANYLAFISFVDLLLENNLVSIGRYVKKETAPYDINMCCLSPSKTVVDGKENRCLIITKILFGAENKYCLNEQPILADKLLTKKQKLALKNGPSKGENSSAFADLIEKNSLDINLFDNDENQLFVKDKGDAKQWSYFLKLDEPYPCTHINSALNEKKLDVLSINELHVTRRNEFIDQLIDQTSSEYKNDGICYNNYDLKKIYDLEALSSINATINHVFDVLNADDSDLPLENETQ